MLSPFIPQKAKILTIKDLDAETKFFELELQGINPYTPDGSHKFFPGQFFEFWVPFAGEIPLAYASSVFDKKKIAVGVRKTGKVTSKLFSMKVGDEVGVRGPLGKGYFPIGLMKNKNSVLVAGGTGIFPIRSLIRSALDSSDSYKNITLCYGAKTPSQIFFQDEFDEWKKRVELCITVDNVEGVDWKYQTGLVTNLICKEKVSQDSIAIIVGPSVMMKASADKLISMGIKEADIYVSFERRMNCGIGICQHCAIGEKYVCHDGPVFKYSDVKEYI